MYFLPAIDGLRYFSSENVHCAHCPSKKARDKEGEERTEYYHAAAQIIRNADGAKKQGCELSAGKRRVEAHGEEYGLLKPTLPGDDLYSDWPFCGKTAEVEISERSAYPV